VQSINGGDIMKKEPLIHKLFGFIDRNVEVSDFVNTGHLGMMNLPIPHMKDPSIYNTQSEEYKNL
jgi:hypothetical protein